MRLELITLICCILTGNLITWLGLLIMDYYYPVDNLEEESSPLFGRLSALFFGSYILVLLIAGTVIYLMDRLLDRIINLIRKIEEKDPLAKKINRKNNNCKGLVPGTFVICGEDNFQYCSQECFYKAKGYK